MQTGKVATGYGAAFSAWLFALVGIVLAQTTLVRLAEVPSWSGIEVMYYAIAATAALSPFVAFAGGAWTQRHEPMRRTALVELALTTAAVAMIFYAVSAQALPHARYARDIARGVDVEQLHPFGPPDVRALLERRRQVVENPPLSYSYSTDRPLERPPNWLDYLIHRDLAFAAFTILNSFLGLLVARALFREGPVAHRRKLWASGLASGFAMLAAMRLGEGLVRSSLTVSGVAMAWLPLVIPLAAIGWLSLGPARPALVHERLVAGEKAEV